MSTYTRTVWIAVMRLTLCCLVVPVLAHAQPSQKSERGGWLAASVGVGSLHLKYSSTSSATADASAGVYLTSRLGLGVQVLGLRTVAFMSDQPGYSARTVLGILKYRPADGAAVLVGGGRVRLSEGGSEVKASGTVMHAGLELYFPSRAERSLRLFALRTWTLSAAEWENATPVNGNPTQTQIGMGFLLR